ncbi:ClpXP protease specificity-enhancing factor [Neisseria gonorrhoeae]|uniref:ClpXP protease specificity-enhancing factor n=1 Tax=Neisseria gonorrhoeae TaxID=485 RepID=A0A378W208_NEIGO|nr:ClpXP protease specificity-enhancing factor [Neisseria gonorrhoeae]
MPTSTKPYILRALCEWCSDNSLTPHILVWVNEHTRVPMQYVRDNEIMLNIGATATQTFESTTIGSAFPPVSADKRTTYGYLSDTSSAFSHGRPEKVWGLNWRSTAPTRRLKTLLPKPRPGPPKKV